MNNILYHVSFPNLGLNLTISSVAFNFGNITIHWYGIIVAIGFLLGYMYVNFRSKSFNLNQNNISDLTLISSVVGIICARVFYVLFYPGDFYKRNPLKIFMINEGGIAIYGAIIGGVLTLVTICILKKIKILKTLDLMSIGLVIGQAIGRWGNFVNQEAFGTETDIFCGMSSENTLFKTVHPCFLYESIGCLIIFLFLHFYSSKQKTKPGTIFFLYTLLYGILRAFIENLRTDSLVVPYTSVKVSQILALFFAVTSLAMIIIINLKKEKL